MKKLFAVVLMLAAGLVYAESEVARHQFTSDMENREPVDVLTSAENINPLYYFTELRDLQDTVVTHRWRYNGEVMADVTFNVGGPRWRVYSSKRFQPQWDGEWTVQVLDWTGVVMTSDTIDITLD